MWGDCAGEVVSAQRRNEQDPEIVSQTGTVDNVGHGLAQVIELGCLSLGQVLSGIGTEFSQLNDVVHNFSPSQFMLNNPPLLQMDVSSCSALS